MECGASEIDPSTEATITLAKTERTNFFGILESNLKLTAISLMKKKATNIR